MSRPVQARESYQTEISRLARLAQAIRLDPGAQEKWKKEVGAVISKLQSMLLNRETQRDG